MRAGKSVVRFRPRGITWGWHKKRVPCEACNYTGLATPLFEGAPARLCCECRGRGYTEHWIRDAATEVAT